MFVYDAKLTSQGLHSQTPKSKLMKSILLLLISFSNCNTIIQYSFAFCEYLLAAWFLRTLIFSFFWSAEANLIKLFMFVFTNSWIMLVSSWPLYHIYLSLEHLKIKPFSTFESCAEKLWQWICFNFLKILRFKVNTHLEKRSVRWNI